MPDRVPGRRDLDGAVSKGAGGGRGDAGAECDAAAGGVCDGDADCFGHVERDEHGATTRDCLYGNTQGDMARDGDAECDLACNRDAERDLAGKRDGIGDDIGMDDGGRAWANADAQAGDGHAQRDSLAERDEHTGADADEHADGGVDAMANPDAETCRDIADTNANTDAAPEIPSLANADATASSESVPDVFTVADAALLAATNAWTVGN